MNDRAHARGRLTRISEPETLAAFERALGVIVRFKSELHHMNTQRRDLYFAIKTLGCAPTDK